MESGASDLHITAGSKPVARVHGHIEPLEDAAMLDPETTRQPIYRITTTEQQKRLELDRQPRLRVRRARPRPFPRRRAYYQREALAAACMIPTEIVDRRSGLLPALHEFTTKPRGLVLFKGPTGSGKSTSLAALIDEINQARRDHIITIEDLIEFLHQHKRCIVNQREIGGDATGFADAPARRAPPGPRRDPPRRDARPRDHLDRAHRSRDRPPRVPATLHTQSAPSTIDRVIDAFPGEQQAQVRMQLANSLQGVVTQTLLPRADGSGRVCALEILFLDDAIRNLIRQGKIEQVPRTCRRARAAACRRWSSRSRS